jgi:hypothetical protein
VIYSNQGNNRVLINKIFALNKFSERSNQTFIQLSSPEVVCSIQYLQVHFKQFYHSYDIKERHFKNTKILFSNKSKIHPVRFTFSRRWKDEKKYIHAALDGKTIKIEVKKE